MLTKVITLAAYKKKIAILLNQIQYFWTLDDVEYNDEFKDGVNFYRKLATKSPLYLTYGGCILITMFLLLAVILKELPLYCYTDENGVLNYKFMYMIETYVLLTATTIVGAFDTFFGSVMLLTALQFKFVGWALQNVINEDINTAEGKRKHLKMMKKIVTHHTFLLK